LNLKPPFPFRTTWVWPVGVAFLTLLVFLPALRNGFVNWDDAANFLNNPHYRGFGWEQLKWMWSTLHMGHYIPLTWMTLGLDYRLWGMNPAGYHFTNILLHAANASLFYLLLVCLLKRLFPGGTEEEFVFPAVLGALVFSIHPLRVESVAWVTERRDVLSGFFSLGTLLAYANYVRLGALGMGRGSQRGWYAGAVVLFGGALLSKSTVAPLAGVLLLLDVYPWRRFQEPGTRWARLLAEKVPFFVLGAAASYGMIQATLAIDSLRSLEHFSVASRGSCVAWSLAYYVWKTAFPVHLSPIYASTGIVHFSEWAFVFWVLIALVTLSAVFLRRRWPGVLAAWGYSLLMLSPSLGIADSVSLMQDRYSYLANLGWSVILASGLLSWRRKTAVGGGRRFFWGGVILSVALLATYATLTIRQLRIWKNSESLWRRALDCNPDSDIANENYGLTLAQSGRHEEAIGYYQKSYAIYPRCPVVVNNMGDALLRLKKPLEALPWFQAALRLRPDSHQTVFNLGVVYFVLNRWTEAVPHFQRALEINSRYAPAHNKLGIAMARLGRWDRAAEHLRDAFLLETRFADDYLKLGDFASRQGLRSEARRIYAEILEKKPDARDVRARLNALAPDDPRGK